MAGEPLTVRPSRITYRSTGTTCRNLHFLGPYISGATTEPTLKLAGLRWGFWGETVTGAPLRCTCRGLSLGVLGTTIWNGHTSNLSLHSSNLEWASYEQPQESIGKLTRIIFARIYFSEVSLNATTTTTTTHTNKRWLYNDLLSHQRTRLAFDGPSFGTSSASGFLFRSGCILQTVNVTPASWISKGSSGGIGQQTEITHANFTLG